MEKQVEIGDMVKLDKTTILSVVENGMRHTKSIAADTQGIVLDAHVRIFTYVNGKPVRKQQLKVDFPKDVAPRWVWADQITLVKAREYTKAEVLAIIKERKLEIH